jgi:hypothetical protein
MGVKKGTSSEKLLFFLVRSRPRGRNVLPSPEFICRLRLPFRLTEWPLPIQALTYSRHLHFIQPTFQLLLRSILFIHG